VQRVDVHVIPTAAPDDVTGLDALIRAGTVDPAHVICLLGKTEGNGCVNDFSRGFATSAFKTLLAQALGRPAAEVAARVLFIMSGGTEGVMAPHMTVFTRRESPGAAGAPGLVAGIAKTRALAPEEIGTLVPEARATTIFALVNALGRRDRRRSLQILDTLTRDGEYLPLALAFLSTQFRMALVSKESGLRSAPQIQGHFTRLGIPVWGSRAEQIYHTVGKFSKEQLELGLKLIFDADRDMRSTRPDDRIVMEKFIFELTR